MQNKIKGDKGERIAAEFLEKTGFKIIRSNYRCRRKEIDIIAEDEAGVLHFIEVKSRSNSNFGKPLEAVNQRKRHVIEECSKLFMAKFKYDFDKKPISFGVISVEFIENGAIKAIHFENAFN